ncbi:MAG TPA: hypothetical protein VFX23_11015 [Limnobacter sp.]|uniref:hypothetical protein n=1 Tax=Limnobacter sp. TaxID=2003368 RepID=UPI002E355149|nr:hypothetical protein [Limnobacter sp.]HEX5486514.1 hypothetical protein [Limnobacter sp.]
MWEFIISPSWRLFLGFFWSAIVFLAGAYCGYRFNVHRDKRKEFNALIDGIIPKIENDVVDPDMTTGAIDKYMIDKLAFYMLPWNKNDFCACAENYRQAKEGKTIATDWPGIFRYENPDLVKNAAKALLQYLQRR